MLLLTKEDTIMTSNSRPQSNGQRLGPGAAILMAAAALAAASCYGGPDEKDLHRTPQGGLDTTTYAGMQIIGETKVGDSAPVDGPLDMMQLQLALFSECYDELVTQDRDGLRKICADNQAKVSSGQTCASHFCLNLLYNCVGYKNLELAEAVDIVEFDAAPMSASGSPTFADGAPVVRPVLTTGGAAAAGGGVTVHYRIAPLPTAVKSLPYRAAQAAFQNAAIQGALVVESKDAKTKTSCVQTIQGWDAGHSDTDPSFTDRFVFGFGESTRLLSETTRKLAANEVAAALAVVAKQPDFARAQRAKWQRSFNSETSALRHILGEPKPKPSVRKDSRTDQPRIQLPSCTMDTARPSVQAALDFVRTTAPKATLEYSASDDAVVAAGIKLIYDRLGDPDVASVDDFLDRKGFSLADVHQARQYLTEEMDAYGVSPVADAEGRLAALSGRTQVGMAHWMGRAYGAAGLSLDLTAANAGQSPMLTLDYARKAARDLLAQAADASHHTKMSREHRVMIAGIIRQASAAVGRYRVRARIEQASAGRVSISVTVAGVEAGDRLLLVDSADGYRCFMYGAINGSPCDTSDFVLATTRVQLDPSVHPVSVRDRVGSIEAAGVTEGDEVYVIVKSVSDGAFDSLGSIEAVVDESGNEPSREVVYPAGAGTFRSFATNIVQRDPNHCGFQREVCRDVDLDRGYVPPLENELTQDSDPYENSWRHYLSLAQAAAAEADALGEKLVGQGLAMDLRSEQMRQQLESVCGGVITDTNAGTCDPNKDQDCTEVDSLTQDESALQNCVATSPGSMLHRVNASIGIPLCYYSYNDTPCGWPTDSDADNSPRCPMPPPTGVTDATGCKGAYQGGQTWTKDFTFSFIGEDQALHLFSSATPAWGIPHCDKVRKLTVDLSIAELDTGSSAWHEARQIWNDLLATDYWWLDPRQLTKIARNLSFEQYPLGHCSLKAGGQTIWTTKVRSPGDCPHDPNPWDESGTHLLYGQCNSQPKPDHVADWLTDEVCTANGYSGAVSKRLNWCDRLFLKAFDFKALTGEVQGMQRREIESLFPGRFYNGFLPDWYGLPAHSTTQTWSALTGRAWGSPWISMILLARRRIARISCRAGCARWRMVISIACTTVRTTSC